MHNWAHRIYHRDTKSIDAKVCAVVDKLYTIIWQIYDWRPVCETRSPAAVVVVSFVS